MADSHFDPFQYLHHFIFRIKLMVWIECGMTNHNRPVENTPKEPILVLKR